MKVAYFFSVLSLLVLASPAAQSTEDGGVSMQYNFGEQPPIEVKVDVPSLLKYSKIKVIANNPKNPQYLNWVNLGKGGCLKYLSKNLTSVLEEFRQDMNTNMVNLIHSRFGAAGKEIELSDVRSEFAVIPLDFYAVENTEKELPKMKLMPKGVTPDSYQFTLSYAVVAEVRNDYDKERYFQVDSRAGSYPNYFSVGFSPDPIQDVSVNALFEKTLGEKYCSVSLYQSENHKVYMDFVDYTKEGRESHVIGTISHPQMTKKFYIGKK